jgi:signal transduction histidine kinase
MTPLQCRNISTKLDTMIVFSPEAVSDLKEYLLSMDSDNPPIPIKYQGNVLGYYHYGVSPVIKQLRWLPYIEIGAALLFVVIGYIGFSQIKKSEQRNIWVGMAKETAHQLGTPLSSMSGWLEILKEDSKNLDKAVIEMDTDIQRLTKVAARFSQIGSVPSLKKTEILPMLENIIQYFNKRLPQLDKKITIADNFKIKPKLMINVDLFEWVIENLIKNAIDAIDGKQGEIELTMDNLNGGPGIFIDVSDNGKGILPRDRKNVFKPGFSTKKRGWGLGLSLAKRIVEDYHGGKLFVKDSRLGEGTIFRIILE